MKDATYINGDKAEYTGKTEFAHGDTCYEAILVEGHRKGETVWTYRAPGHVGAYTGRVGSGRATA